MLRLCGSIRYKDRNINMGSTKLAVLVLATCCLCITISEAKLSPESQQIISRIDKDLEGKIGSECDAKLKTLTSLATDQTVGKMCELFKAVGKDMVKDKCSSDEVGKIEHTVCKPTTTDTPKTAVADTVAHVVEKIVARLSNLCETCKTLVSMLQEGITDERSLKLSCMKGKNKWVKIFLQKDFRCSDNDIETIFSAICDEMMHYEASQFRFQYVGKIENTVCKSTTTDEPKTDETETVSMLSKSSQQIISRIDKDLKGKIGSECDAKLKTLTSLATDESVGKMCELFKVVGKNMVNDTCSRDEVGKIENIVCKSKTPDTPNTDGAETIAAVVERIVEKLSILSGTCKKCIPILQKQITNQERLKLTCMYRKSNRGRNYFKTKFGCADDDIKTIFSTICDEMKSYEAGQNKFEYSEKLSKGSNEILKQIFIRSKGHVSNACQLQAASLYKQLTEDKVYSLCELIQQYQGIVSTLCDNKGYEFIKDTICSVLKMNQRPKTNMTAKAKQIMDNVNDTLNQVSQQCADVYKETQPDDIENLTDVTELCSTIEKGKEIFNTFCTEDEYSQLRTATCEKPTTYNSLSKLGRSVLDEIVKDIDNIKLSESCMTTGKPALLAKATNDEYIFGLCDTIVANKSLVAIVCGDDGYTKLKTVVCSKIEEASKHRPSSNATKLSTKLSKKSKQIIARIDEDLEGKIGSECDAKLKTLTFLATDQTVGKMCELFKAVGNNLVKDKCSSDEVGKIENTVCKPTTTDTPISDNAEIQNSLSKLGRSVLDAIVKDIDNIKLSEGCMTTGKPALLAKATNDEYIFGLCDTIVAKKSLVAIVCGTDGYDKLKSLVCSKIEEALKHRPSLNATKPSTELSKSSQIISRIDKDLKGKIGSECDAKLKTLTSMTTDQTVGKMCELFKSVGKNMVKDTCSRDEVGMIENTVCKPKTTDTPKTDKTETVSKLSKSSQQVLACIDKAMKGKIGNDCAAKLKTLTSMDIIG